MGKEKRKIDLRFLGSIDKSLGTVDWLEMGGERMRVVNVLVRLGLLFCLDVVNVWNRESKTEVVKDLYLRCLWDSHVLMVMPIGSESGLEMEISVINILLEGRIKIWKIECLRARQISKWVKSKADWRLAI